jgi:phosphohistidine phosphatase SixA
MGMKCCGVGGEGWPRTAGRVSVLAVLIALALLVAHPPAEAANGDRLWALLKGGGQIVLIRHASTVPGVGDPPGFRVEDCATQRNLSEAGREEARRIGAAFRERGIPVGEVLSSRWCRCLDTARLAFGSVKPWPALDSFFDDRSREPEQTRAVRERASQPLTRGNLILVTHQVNITALTGLVPSQGEMVMLTPRDGGFTVAGRFNPAAGR